MKFKLFFVMQKYFQMIPHELWHQIFTFLDLQTQALVSKVSEEFYELIVALWRAKLLRLLPQFEIITADHNEVRLNVTMKALLRVNPFPLQEYSDTFLFKMLRQHRMLQQTHDLEILHDIRFLGHLRQKV